MPHLHEESYVIISEFETMARSKSGRPTERDYHRSLFGLDSGGMNLPVRLGPAGVPLSCKGRTIVEGMDDIISLGLETMEVQTVRMVAPQHFEQYWQAGVLANKTARLRHQKTHTPNIPHP